MSEVDFDRLADYIGGALDGTPLESEVRQLIATESAWALAFANLASAQASVTSALSVLAEVREPMPEAVSDRLLAALRAEGLAADSGHPGGTGHPAAERAGQTRRPDGADGRGPAERRPPARPRSRRRRTTFSIAALVVIAIAAIASLPILRKNAEDAGSGGVLATRDQLADAPRAAPLVLASGDEYTRATISDQVAAALRVNTLTKDAQADAGGERESSTASGPAGGQRAPEELRRLVDPQALTRCLSTIVTRHGGSVSAVDYARFEGQAALIAVLSKAPAAVGRPLVVVVGPSCGVDQDFPDERYVATG